MKSQTTHKTKPQSSLRFTEKGGSLKNEIRPPHPYDLSSSLDYKMSEWVRGYLAAEKFEDDKDGFLMAGRYHQYQAFLDSMGNVQTVALVRPEFEGSEAIGGSLETALVNSHLVSNTVVFLDGDQTPTAEEISHHIAQGNKAVGVRKYMANVPKHPQTGNYEDKPVEYTWKAALSPWMSGLSDASKRAQRKSLNNLAMEGQWKARDEDELHYKDEMEGIRNTQDDPTRLPLPSYVKEILKTFPAGATKPKGDLKASIIKQCHEFPVWAIGATPGAVSQRHRDAVGSFSYLIVHSGRKLWIMREGLNDAPHRNDVVELGPGDLFYAYMVWYGFELLRPEAELIADYGSLKKEIAKFRQEIRDLLALPVVEGMAKIRKGQEQAQVQNVLFYMLAQAAVLAQRLDEEGFSLPEVEKEQGAGQRKRKKGIQYQ
ncbi:hypothetical protein NCC49_006017 [Naganishia albida]|nr:hypothetical protein NCC49_006017 [Naganishia albida]